MKMAKRPQSGAPVRDVYFGEVALTRKEQFEELAEVEGK
jgi:hypothetical protein